jgi:hypothetical protein
MLITPAPGVDRETLRRALASVHQDVSNIEGGGPHTAHERLLAYLDWTSSAVRMLGNQISIADVDRLILTRRYELLLSGVGQLGGSATERVVNGLVNLELSQRVAAFDEALRALDSQIERWSRPKVFVVADSSVYIESPVKLEELDFAPLCEVREEPIHILVPIVVVDELDGLKQSKRQQARWRAGYTLAVLDRIFGVGTEVARLREADSSAVGSGGIPRGEVTMELLFDSPGHTRLPINDDEIIDRALAVQSLAGRPVTLLTYDTGQSTRARAAGLKVRKLRDDAGEGPEPQRQ